ncbi:Ig-like domain-containing protein [Spirosoma sp. SC4-14]|uniref:Ig-like domain-containing protein n=1 Tax=Spirosoma sp. SC4-14 TaxID=3128900 RepID=UPI0030CDD8AA
MKTTILGIVAGLIMLCYPALAQRDPLKWPFAKTSIWNIPIHNNAVYAPAGIQDATYFEADEDVVIFRPNEPLMNVETNYAGWSGQDRCPVQGPTLFSAPIPTNFIYDKNVWVGKTPNAGVAILQPDGKIWQAQPFAKCGTDVATAQYKWDPSGCVLTGECIQGAHGGSHLSAIGGTIRVGEFTSGKIPHVIKLNLFGKENFYHDATGGYRWPATNQDGGYNDPTAYNYYGGTNPEMKIGALLALNKDVVLNSVSDNSLGLKTQAGLILARTLRDYGGYTVDNTAGDTYAFVTETGPEGSVRNEFKQLYGYDINGGLGTSDWANDIKLLYKNLYVITNNLEGNPGGGPISDLTNRRAPAAPDFSPAQTFKIMPLGDSKTEGGGGGNTQNSWRGYLRTRLIRNGYKLDYVGDRQNYAEGDTIPNDKDHAGHGGYTIGPDTQTFCSTCETTGLYEHIQDYLPQANPDIVLLAIGINDMFGADAHPPGYMASAPQRYQDLVNKILQLKPGVRLILGTIEPVKWDKNWGSNPSDKSLGALNAKIREIANASDTDNIYLADIYQKMYATWDPGDYFDDLHLSKQGATKDANAWFDALVPILNNTPANVAPAITLTSPVQSATFSAPATINFEATANDSDGSVTKVEFYNGSAKIGEATASPFRYTWNDVDEGTYLLKAVATDNLYATAASAIDTVTVKSTDGYVKFTGTGIGSPGSYENNGKTFAKALDGDLTTYFDGASASGQWVGLDMGIAKTVRKARIVPRTAWALRIVGGKIQGSNSPDFSNAVDLYTFTQTPIEGFYTTARFATTGLYRYYRFLSPNNGYGNISELEFWGNPNDPTNQVPVCKIDSTLNNTRLAPGASLTLTASASDPDGTITKVEFFSGTALIGTSTAAPYQYVWTNLSVGTYFVTAKATDNAGVSKTSDAVKITVDNLGSDVLYAEDYNTNTAVGWVANGGTWTATNQRYESTNTNGEFTSFYNGASFSNYSYAVDATASWDNNIGVVFNYQNTNNYYLLTFNSKAKTVDLKKKVNGTLTTIASTTFTGGGTGTSHAILITNTGGTTTVKINGNTVFNNVATTDFTSGKIGLYSFYCPSRFDNVVVRSVGTQSAPTVALTSPVASATFTAPATITLTASANSTGGSISKVEFYNGTTLLGSATTSPYSFAWSNVATGTYALTAKATDNSGAVVTSSVVSITVGTATVQESIAFNKPPMVVNPGQSYTVNVNYTAAANRIIDVYLFNSQWQTITSKNVQVSAGSGTQAITLTIPAGAAPIKGGNWSVNLWKSDWSSAVKSNLVSGVRVNAQPTVNLTSPVASTTFTAGTAVELAATANDADGTVSKVEFYNGTTLLGSATTSPYAFTLTNVSAGTYTLTAKAVDNDGLAATSTALTIDVKAAPSAMVRVLHKDADNVVANNVIKPTLQVLNEGDAPLVYGQLTLRYWLTAENFAPLSTLPVYYAQIGNNKIRVKYVALDKPRQGAWGYVEYSFDESAGQLMPGANSGEIQSGIAKQNNTDFNEADDYSYANAQNLTANDHITAYINGQLAWGTEPTEVAVQQRLTVYNQNRTNGANTINTYLQVRNEGNVPVNYQDVKVRYYLTAEGNPDKLRFYLDYALLGNANVTGQFVKLNPVQTNADAYLELSFNANLGALYPASSTGDVQYRVAKDDWTDFNQSNDYSYLAGTNWLENNQTVIYLAGQRVWGQEPGSGARVAAEAEIPFQVTVLGNPVSGPEVAVEVQGAGGQPLRIQLTDTKGTLLSNQLIEQATSTEQVRVSLGQTPTGILLLRVSTPSQNKTVKILKENP